MDAGGGPDIFRATVTSDRKHGHQHGSAPAGGSDLAQVFQNLVEKFLSPCETSFKWPQRGVWPSLAQTHFDHFGDIS